MQHTLFQNEHIETQPFLDGIGVFAKNFIKQNTLLVLEHTFTSADPQTILGYLAFDSEFSDSLHPREYASSPKQRAFLNKEKMNSNVFGLDNDGLIHLGNQINKFNHHCNYNAVGRFNKNKIGEICMMYSQVVTVKPIKRGEQIFVFYHPQAGHSHCWNNFSCNCGNASNERQRIHNSYINLMSKSTAFLDRIVSQFIEQYEKTYSYTSIVFRQYMAQSWVYIIKNKAWIVEDGSFTKNKFWCLVKNFYKLAQNLPETHMSSLKKDILQVSSNVERVITIPC